MFDLLIANGTVVDGSGRASLDADLGIHQGRIEAIGDLSQASAKTTIDARGMYVSPGFIDLHSHSDFTLLLDSRAESFIRQGVTTEVIGNCGMSAAPLKHHEDLKRNVFCYLDPFEPRWSSLDEYFSILEGNGLGINVAPLVGHAALRSYVMGFEQRGAIDQEQADMEQLLADCLEIGAWGMSSGLEYFPGSSANPGEIDGLCRVVSQFDGLYATHVRNRDENYKEGFREPLDTALRSGARLQISHIVPKYGAPPEAARWTLDQLSSYAEHIDVACDAIPYEWGPTTMTAILPASLLKHNISEIVTILSDPSRREPIKHQKQFFWLLIRDQCWDSIKLYHSRKFPELIGRNGFELAEALKTTPFDALLDILAEEGEHMFSVLMMGKIKRENDLADCIADQSCSIISDGLSLSSTGPLQRINWSPGCYGWVPRFFERFVGPSKLLSIEEGVSKITGAPARRLGLSDRGLIKKGYWADIVVFDPEQLIDRTSLEDPAVYPTGINDVVINGEIAVENGQYSSRRQGRLLRKFN
ncbi:amidohydrolase family protein [Thermodesulfobacteriota bacterium]